MKIHSYESSSGKDLIIEYIMNLTEDEKVVWENLGSIF